MPKKPHVKAIRAVIEKELGIGIRQIYRRAKGLATKAHTGPEDGIYLLAAQNQINLSKYHLPKEKVADIRQMLFQLNQQAPPSQIPKPAYRKTVVKTVSVTVGKTFVISDPLLTDKVLAEAKQMAEEVYPILYVFENSAREMIARVMQKAHGDDWWDKKVSRKIHDNVQKRKEKEKQNPWHGKRGAHSIHYTDLKDLARIVQDNLADFQAILPNQQWLTQRLEEIGHSRNPVAHMNPVGKRDIQRIKLYFQDWQEQIREKRNLIP